MSRKQPTLKGLKAKCWKLFSEYIRRKDADEGGTDRCYTCGGVFHWKELQAGHAIPGRHNAVLFDEEIVRPQCATCNVFRRGQYHIFTTKLIREKGMEWWERKLVESRKAVKWTHSDLESYIAGFKEKLANLERGSIPCTSSQSPGSSENQDQLAEVEGQ